MLSAEKDYIYLHTKVISLLEWTDDLELFILKGYGNSLNYQMEVPLLQDVLQAMEQAIKAQEEKHAPGSYEKARLHFAHEETVVPFSCLLGLFREGSVFKNNCFWFLVLLWAVLLGCDSDFCPFELFKENIVYPHLKSNYNQVCMVKREAPEQKPSMAKTASSSF
nr:isoform 4 of multiple inositol polyphosphate phosphatase 1 [Quercus suber]